MRAIVQHAYGGPEVLQLTEVSRPEPMVTEVLVRVHAAGVNPIDAKTRAGGGFAPQMGRPPFIPGWDLSGVVVQIGYGVTRFQPGDEVYGMPNFPRRAGTYAEFVTVRSRQVARKPTSLSHVEAAALPLAGLTAWQSLVDTAQVGPGMRVLIHAAAGGVGHLAVQIAKARGAYVIGTARAAKHDFVRSLGADEVIDYTAGAFEDAVEPVEVVLDLVGGDTRRRSLEVLAQGGLLIPLPRGLDVSQEAAERGLRVAPLIVEPDYRGLEHLAELADSGRLKVSVSRELPLAQAAEAHRYIDGGGATGKTVLTVISPS
ncbi:NADP-dependent oxidoreductase [Nonomuraea turkmeniaca]|uniref:NADP-dependent oxidoreductase n=2 Tax=Nonomuraea turkmeniaca TaxID=103838 RepID=A0A5S4FK54_9ACTN|nr:NADP-dependent oxidoreductase [Nonomuraea turkmeniaca]